MGKAKKWTRLIVGILLFAAGIYAGKLMYKTEAYIPPPQGMSLAQSNDSTLGNGTIEHQFSGTVHEVKDGEKIQDAVNKAQPGDLIRVFPGTYHETVYIDKDNLSFQGITVDGEWATLDGEKKLNDGFLYSGNNIVIDHFRIINYKGNGIMGQAGNNFVLRNNLIEDAGVYGIFPEFGKNGLIEHNILSGIEDAAIYVGMCDNIDVVHNEVFASVAGIEIENSRHALVEGNYAHDNTGGLLVFITPGLPIKTCYDVILRNNFVVNNNHKNFGAPGSMVSGVPKGTGILIMAADDVIIDNNIISGNDNAGITIVNHKYGVPKSNDPDSDPYPDRTTILDNVMINNGLHPGEAVKTVMMSQFHDQGPDIIDIGGGKGNTIKNKDQYRSFGLGSWGPAQIADTRHVRSYLLDKPVEPREIPLSKKSELTYYGICAGCHSYSMRMVGPPTVVIQALYKDNPQGIADFIANPVHKREDYPEMPTQNYLDEETRLAVAKFMLSVKK